MITATIAAFAAGLGIGAIAGSAYSYHHVTRLIRLARAQFERQLEADRDRERDAV